MSNTTQAVRDFYATAKVRSIEHNEIATLRVDSREDAEELAMMDVDSDDNVETGNVWEVWGTADGEEYRVHIVWPEAE